MNIDVADLDEATRLAAYVREQEERNMAAIQEEFGETLEELGFSNHRVWVVVVS